MRRVLAAGLMAAALTAGSGQRIAPADPVFRAIVILERRPPGAAPRVSFEWSQRAGAIEYRLAGSWTEPDSWTVRRLEFGVTRKNATTWDERQVTFEVSLAPGSHSWRLIPVRPPNGTGPPSEAAQLGFDLK
jgi:hypothetical protein